jgi:hypothetical protein
MQLIWAAPVFEFYSYLLFKTVFSESSPAGLKRNWESPSLAPYLSTIMPLTCPRFRLRESNISL